MSFIKNMFGKKEEPIKTYDDFWDWFSANEQTFYNIVKSGKNLEKDFFNKLSPKLEELKDGFFFLTGMYDDSTAELILTPDGVIKNIVFIEELVKAAPSLNNWKFTALKPELDIDNASINMAGYIFNSENLFFYSIDDKNYPDEVYIVVVHNDYNEADMATIINGTYIFLDNYLGELNSVTTIDNLTVISNADAEKELIPIRKLKDYLIWRQKEFVEKYDDVRYNTEDDEHSILEADLESGNTLVAMVNTELLNWDNKASHPWIAVLILKYNGSHRNGMPDDNDFESLNKIEEDILQKLLDKDGYLYIGRQTADSERSIYFACKDFRKPSKTFHEIQKKYKGRFEIAFDIYKDKYWQSFERFRPT